MTGKLLVWLNFLIQRLHTPPASEGLRPLQINILILPQVTNLLQRGL
jgi:hypothetical protein